MSRRSLLAARGTASVVPDPPPVDPDPDPDPDPETPAWPETDDPIIEALRPRVVREQAVIEPGDSIGVTIGELRALIEPQPGYLDELNLTGPDFQTIILLTPGTYDQPVGIGGFEGIVGGGATPADTVIQTSSEAADGVLHPYGSGYYENLTLRTLIDPVTGYSPKYPAHVSVGAATYFVNCVLDASEGATLSNHGTFAALGMDGSARSVLVLYRCTLIAGPGTAFDIQGHGTETQTEPHTVALIDCTFLNPDDHFNRGRISLSGENSSGQQSALYVIGCTGVNEIVSGPTTDVYTDLDVTVTNAGNVFRDVTEWPVPVDGLDAYWSDYYFPSAIGENVTQRITGVTTAPMQPVANRIYYTKVRLDQAMRATHSGVTLTTAAGNVGIQHEPDDGAALNAYALTAAIPATVGDMVWQHVYARTRYPGGDGFWVASKFSSTDARVTGTTQLPDGDAYYSDDGSTLVPVATGTLHPLAFVQGT